MFERVFKNLVTSIIGLVLLAGSGFLVYRKDIAWEQFTAFLPFCLAMLWSKNSFITDIFKSKASGVLPVLLVLFLVAGCCTQKRCGQKFPAITNTSSEDSTGTSSSDFSQDKDSLSNLPADSSWIKLYLECNQYGQVLIKRIYGYEAGKNVNIPQVDVSNNVLTSKCKVDSIAVYNHISKRFKKEVQYRDRKVTETKYINQLTTWQKTQIKAFWAETVLLLVISFLFISKIIR